MAAQNAQMQSINGIGTTISWAILAYLGIDHSTEPKPACRFSWGRSIQPRRRQIQSRKPIRIEGGRAKVRKCLYMTVRRSPILTYRPMSMAFAPFKTYKCAIVAALRSLSTSNPYSKNRNLHLHEDTVALVRYLITAFLLLSLISGHAKFPDNFQEPIQVIAFGSCNRDELPQPVWPAVESLSPDLWIWAGIISTRLVSADGRHKGEIQSRAGMDH